MSGGGRPRLAATAFGAGTAVVLAAGMLLLRGLAPVPVLAGGSARPCSSESVSTDANAPIAPGAELQVTALASCPGIPQYAFFTAALPPAGQSPHWTLERGWGGGTLDLATSRDQQDGGYLVLAWATDGDPTTPQVQASAAYSLLWPGACSAVSTSVQEPSGVLGTPAVLQASAQCGETPQYAYFAAPAPAAGSAPQWRLVQGWTSAPTFSYPTSSWLPGSYWLLAWATDGPAAAPQAQQYSTYTVLSPPPCTSSTVSTNTAGGVIGDPVTLAVSPTCPAGSGVFYAYWFQPQGSQGWTLAQGWTSSSTFIYQTSGWAAGGYNLMAWASTVNGSYQGVQAQLPFDLAPSGGFTVSGISTYDPQIYTEDCEEAALQMALEHESIYASQQQILTAETVNSGVPGIGPGIDGDPYQSFVGPLDGIATEAYEPGTYFPTVARAAGDLGAHVLADGQNIAPEQLYTDIENDHPAVAWVTPDFQYFQARVIGANGDQFPWAGPVEHAVLVIGVGANSVLIWNPLSSPRPGRAYVGESWVPMAQFQAAYATYDDMAVVLS